MFCCSNPETSDTGYAEVVEPMSVTATTKVEESPPVQVIEEKQEEAPAPVAVQEEKVEEVKPEPVKEVQPEPINGVTIEFKLPDSSIKSIVFDKKPLGITFAAGKAPLTVLRLVEGGEGELKQVEKGWEFSSVGGQSTNGLSYDEVLKILQQGTANLPARPDAAKK
mmetsp:Transcript_14934/g.24426  ORF Transcript_14934/g.24426 Transcript_14934/m.24426 type:complete len:166 (+) Transcript_14934:70-567(+)